MRFFETSPWRCTALAGVALAALVGIASASAEDGTIKLGFTGALTGPFNEFGEGIRRGIDIAIEEWNKKGGVNGKKLELAELLDDQLVPDRAVQNMRRILDNEEIVAIIGPSGSGPTLAIIDMIEPGSTIKPITSPGTGFERRREYGAASPPTVMARQRRSSNPSITNH